VLSAKDDARAIAGAFNTLALSQLKDYADELGDSLEQAIVRWNDSSPPQVGSFIYTRQGRGKVLSVDTAAQTVTVERQLKVGEKVCVPGGGQGTITSVNNSGDTATIELLGIEYREGTTPPVQPSPAIIRVGDWVYPRLQEGDIVRTTRRDWKCLVGSYLPPTLTPFAPARATIVLQERTFLEYYVALRDNMLRHAQSVIRLISNLTASDDLTILERVVFSRYLSDRFAELYYSLPDEGGALFGDRIKVQLAWNILRPLTKDSVDDAFFNAELVDKHRILNGVAERLKNRLDRVLKDWENEDKLIIALHNLNPARFPFENRAEIQRLIFRIKGVSSQETLGAILKEQERLSDKEIQNVLEIQAIQVRRTQLLRSMHLDSWTLYKVTDCHYDRDTEPKQIVVRPAS
jgi:hypothetical protein